MTGANYTGGKRNFARTRFRDSTRRVQKNHFGRRRLGILSRSLLANATDSKDEETAPGMSSILLEHAQREIPRLPTSFPASHAEPPGAFTFNPSSSSGSSRTGSNLTHVLDSGSYSSLRAEMDRVLEFSRTVGLCNYPNSRGQGVLVSSASDVDSESEQLDLNQPRNGNYDLPMSEVSERQASTSYTVQGSENLRAAYSRPPHFNSFRESASPSPEERRSCKTDLGYAKPASDYLEFCSPQSTTQLIGTAEPQLDQDECSPEMLERNLYPADPLPLSFDALEFPTSPLPPSSPLPSSTAYGSFLSLYQTPRATGKTRLDLGRIKLPSALSDSHEVDSSSHSGFNHGTTPDWASTPRLRHIPRSRGLHKASTLFASSSNKDDLIPDLLTRDDPWNVIGDILDLPPIPSADATYLSNIASLPTDSHKRVLPQTSSPNLRQADVRVPCSPPRYEDNWLRAVHSDGPLPIRPVSSRIRSRHPGSSPLLYRNLLTKKAFLPTDLRRGCGPELPKNAGSDLTSPSPARSLLIRSRAFQLPPELQTLPTLPRALDRSPISGQRSSSSLVKTPSSDFVTLRRSKLPSPKQLSPQKTFSPRTPEVVTTQWNAISEIDLDLLIPKEPMTQTTKSRTQHPMLECPDLFKDEDDSLGGIF